MPTVLELPLREKGLSQGERVVGTVIGHLRATGTGALRPVPLSSPRTRAKRTLKPATGERTTPLPIVASTEPFSLDHLLGTQKQWRDWLAVAKDSSSRRSTPAELERWERLDASLATLCDCLVRTHSPSLRAALAAEAGAVVSAIRSEMRG